MSNSVFLITPPFTQLNTPYPATAYLKGFLNTKNISSFQTDLGIEVTLALFCKNGLTHLFNQIIHIENISENSKRIINHKHSYIHSIDSVILFLQGKNPTLAHHISSRKFLPEANRFLQLDDLKWAFGTMGIQDKAKHICTMYLEDLSDFISEFIDPYFGFSRYAERLARSANSFDELYNAMQQKFSFVDNILIEILSKKIIKLNPKLVCISVPFPGNLYSALRCGQWIKKNHPNIKVAMGGGFANTELRSLTDIRVFDFFDFITLDDGEAPIENLIKYVNNDITIEELKRTFICLNNKVTFMNNASCNDYKQEKVGTPDYSDLWLEKYISAIEIINPMHSLWSDGRWNKLTMAHGCYWGKCTFCDISLSYIKLYEPITAAILCDKMEILINQTGQTGFHFVDEAAPPSLMKALAIEIIKRKLVVSWWTNIRFEKSFTIDLCLLLKASGCIGVSGGLEVASDRLLALIKKGITVSQVAQVNKNFANAGIMVHAYLMYGFPTQTAQETIDSLEMVRQLFEANILQSAFWHQFALTAHSPVGQNPNEFNVQIISEEQGSFANNDIQFIDSTGTDHDSFSFGLKKSLFNFMQGTCFDYPLQKWFDMKVPKTSIDPNFIMNSILHEPYIPSKPTSKYIWIGNEPNIEIVTKSKKGNQWKIAEITFCNNRDKQIVKVDEMQGRWLVSMLSLLSIYNEKVYTLQEIKKNYESNYLEDFELFWDNKPINTLHKMGLLCL